MVYEHWHPIDKRMIHGYLSFSTKKKEACMRPSKRKIAVLSQVCKLIPGHLVDKPKTCSALRGAVNTMDGSFPAFPKLSRASNPAWEYRPLQAFPAASLENLGEGHRRNRSISLVFKALDSFSVGPTYSAQTAPMQYISSFLQCGF